MTTHKTYKALAPCRVGTYREAGEEFDYPAFEVCPSFLQELSNSAKNNAPEKLTRQHLPQKHLSQKQI